MSHLWILQVNGPLSEDGDKSLNDSMSDDGQESRNTGTPSSIASMSSLPPAAHSSSRLTTPDGSRSQTPIVVKQENIAVKQEPMDVDDAPLDFSVKSRTPTPSAVKSSAADMEDVPMDLSVKKKEDSPIKPSVKVCCQKDDCFTTSIKFRKH